VWRGQQMVGILLPPSIPGALVNFAALLMGKTPVNLNYTASDEILAACARECGLRTVITSRAFLERVRVHPPVSAVMLEDLAQNPGKAERLLAALMSWLFLFGFWKRRLVPYE
jgi:acyl-[acyl-carrier-protein]-phospholipid O-acyltransferase/long-chain-fatty-acid--[acyl-carrier-protein] ligase